MEPAAGGKGWFCVQKNCRADEEQTWPLSSRKRWELEFQEKKKKDKTRDHVYNSCSEV